VSCQHFEAAWRNDDFTSGKTPRAVPCFCLQKFTAFMGWHAAYKGSLKAGKEASFLSVAQLILCSKLVNAS
jgi:hypothetical protein